jgi:hypothetical protein
MRVELVPTTNLVLNWANARSESHQLDKNLSTIKSQIRNGRHILMEQSKKEFLEIDEMFL